MQTHTCTHSKTQTETTQHNTTQQHNTAQHTSAALLTAASTHALNYITKQDGRQARITARTTRLSWKHRIRLLDICHIYAIGLSFFRLKRGLCIVRYVLRKGVAPREGKMNGEAYTRK